MYQNIFFLLLFILLNTKPIFAQTKPPQIKTNLVFYSEKFLGEKNRHRYSTKGSIKLDLKYSLKNLSSQLSIYYSKDDNYTLDRSYLEYT